MDKNLFVTDQMNTWLYCTNTELDEHSSFSEVPTIFVLSTICLASHSSSRQSQEYLQKRCLQSHMFVFTQHTSHIGYNSRSLQQNGYSLVRPCSFTQEYLLPISGHTTELHVHLLQYFQFNIRPSKLTASLLFTQDK
jgi:hypothetical protein